MSLSVRYVVTLTLLFAACGESVHPPNGTKPIVYLILEDTDSSDLPSVSAVKSAVESAIRDVALDESTYLKCLSVKCNGGTNYTAKFDNLTDEVLAMGDQMPPVIILEGTCLEDSILIAEASSQFNFTLVSYSSACLTEPMTYFPNHFCVVPTSVSSHYGIAGVFDEFKWITAQIFTEDDYSLAYDTNMLVEVLNGTVRNRTMNMTSIMINKVNISREEEILVVPNYHILILNTSPEQARDIICEAEVGYPNYLWIIPDWYPHEWWIECSLMSKCTQEELKIFLNRSLTISYQPDNTSGRVPDQFRSQFDEAFFAPYAYDSVWAIDHGLKNCINCSTDMIRESLETSNFQGVSGRVSFENGARTLDQVTVLQFRRGSDAYEGLNEEKIACISPETLQFDYKDNENASTVWPDGIPPDGTTILIQKFIHSSTIVVFYVFAAAGIVFAIVCFAFTCRFRKRKLIRLTSPGLNYIIIVGTVLLYLSVIPTAHPRGLYEATEEVFCPLSTYVLLLGYNMTLVTIDVRMWRVFYKFWKPHSRACKDWHLMIIIASLMVVDIITLTITNAVPLERYFAPMFPDPEHPSTLDERGVPILFLVIQCVPRADNYWLIVIYSYKGIFQIVGVVLALITIKMKAKYYNEATEVRRILYTTTFFLLILLVELYFWLGYINVHAAVTSFGLCTISTLVLGLIFIPKMIGLYRDPEGKEIIESPIPSAVSAAKETNDAIVATNVLALKAEEMELGNVVN